MKINLRNEINSLLVGLKVKPDSAPMSEQEVRELLIKRNIKPSKIEEATKVLIQQGFGTKRCINPALEEPICFNEEETLAEIERLEKSFGWK